MRAALKDDPILVRFRRAVREVYGGRLDRIVLFGSRARGDHRPDSDYDIAVFIRDHGSFWDETGRLARVEEAILLDSGKVINSLPFPAGTHRKHTAFMGELREDGLDL
jgi:predicted nucleotidyltransferase